MLFKQLLFFLTYFSYLSKVLTNISHQKIFKFARSFGATFPIFFAQKLRKKSEKYISRNFWIFWAQLSGGTHLQCWSNVLLSETYRLETMNPGQKIFPGIIDSVQLCIKQSKKSLDGILSRSGVSITTGTESTQRRHWVNCSTFPIHPSMSSLLVPWRKRLHCTQSNCGIEEGMLIFLSKIGSHIVGSVVPNLFPRLKIHP